MRYLYTLLFAALSLNAFSQNNAIHVYPWNPDANHNNSIGTDDLLPFLSVFGEEFGLPPEPCTYDGTPLEDLVFGIADGTIILDSMFIEYELEDVSTYYILGCPDPTTDTVFFVSSMMLANQLTHQDRWAIDGLDGYGIYNEFEFKYDAQVGEYRFILNFQSLSMLGFSDDGFFSAGPISVSDNSTIPFPDDWSLDENGIHIESGWDNGDFVYYANYLHILPYWHYADE